MGHTSTATVMELDVKARTRRFLGVVAGAVLAIGLGGCASDDPSSQTSAPSSSTPVASTSITSPAPSTNLSVTATQPAPTTTEEEVATPGPEPVGKEISSCATTTLYQAGTTWYTDGTSGWTQYCQDQYYAANPLPEGPVATCGDGEVVNEGSGTYSTCQGGQWIYVSPTFDPDSGDGYGPNQPLPPLCVRFPDQYTC